MKVQLAKVGTKYINAATQRNNEKQPSDFESPFTREANVLIVLTQGQRSQPACHQLRHFA